MRKRVLAAFLSVCLAVSLLGGAALPAAAEDAAGDPLARDLALYPEARSFLVESQEDLEAMAAVVNGGKDLKGYTFLQTEDITLEGEFTPIGKNLSNATGMANIATIFKGTYDGGCHTISNLNINLPGQNGVGLFGACYGATLRNIGIESGSVTGANRAGGIAGYADACQVLSCYNKADIQIVSGVDGAGGIAGVARDSAVITGCANFGSVTAVSAGAGGIAGWGASNITLRACYSGGAVLLSGTSAGSGATDAFGRCSAGSDRSFASCWYLQSVCESNFWGGQALAEENLPMIAYRMNDALGTGNRNFTVDTRGDFVFMRAGRSGIDCMNLRTIRGGVMLEGTPVYLPDGGYYTVPAEYGGAAVESAAAGGKTYLPGAEIPAEDGLTVNLYVAGSYPAAGDIELYPEEKIFIVASAEQLSTMAMMVNKGYTYEGAVVYVTQDLDFSNFARWTPIGTVTSSAGGVAAAGSCAFKGRFNGQFHRFENIRFSQSGDYQALFGYLEGATVENVILGEGLVSGDGARTAALCSLMRGSAVRNIESHLAVTSTAATDSLNLGLVSLGVSSLIEGCLNYGDLGLADSESRQENGGICGYGFSSTKVNNCFAAGENYGADSETIARACTVTQSFGLSAAGAAGTLSWDAFLNGEGAWRLNTASGTAANTGLWGTAAYGPMLKEEEAVFRAAGILIDAAGEQFGETDLYYRRGEAVAFPEQPGYTFDYAVSDGAVIETGWEMPGRDCEIYLHYRNQTYPVTLQLNGGTLAGEAPETHTVGYAQALPSGDVLTRAGFSFAGWFENAELEGEPVTEIPADLCREAIYYAAWAEPVVITTAAQLAALAEGDLSGSYQLGADIDMTGVAFTPIGTSENPFFGVFDGAGFTISGLQIDSDAQYQGLFGFNTGRICNLTLSDDCSISGSAFTGGIAGYSSGSITDCITSAAVSYKAQQQESYRMMSQNLCIWGDGSFAVANRRPWMVARIEREQPDIVGMQEGSTSWVTYLERNLSGYTLLYQYRHDKESTPVAYKTDRFDLVDSGTFWLSETPETESLGWDGSHYRICTWVILRNKQSGELISLFNTHLDVGSATARLEGAKLVKSRMEQMLARYPGLMIFSSGDYNTGENSAPYNVLTSDGFGDTRYLAEESDTLNTHSSDLTDNWVNASSSRIDFIMAYAPNVSVTQFKVLAETVNGTRLSDHNGLIATFHAVSGICFGGAVGVNTGTLNRIISYAPVEGGEEAGALAGRNTGTADRLYYLELTEGIKAVGGGSEPTDSGLLTSQPFSTPEFCWALNENAGRAAFTLVERMPAVAGTRGYALPVRLMVNGTPVYALAGDTVQLDTTGFTDPVCALDGVYFPGTALTAPEGDATVTIIENTACTTHDFGGWEAVDAQEHRRTCRANASHFETAVHQFSEPFTVPAGCGGSGYTARRCSDCGYLLKTDETPATGHLFGAWQPFSAEEHLRVCTQDSSHREYAAHRFDEGVFCPPGCEEAGVIRYTCLDCGYTETVAAAGAAGHAFGDWEPADALHHQRICANDESHIELAAHLFTASPEEAGCETGAGTRYTCRTCGYSYLEETGAPLGHDYGDWRPLDAQFHDAVCSHDSRHRIQEAHTFGEGVTAAPTCEAAGYTRHTCTGCGYYYDTDPVAALGHDYGAWEVVSPAGETERGLLVRTCSVCSGRQERVLPAGNDPAVCAAAGEPQADGTLQVEIRLQNNPGLASLQIQIDYDPALLQLESAESLAQGPALGSLLFGSGLEGHLNDGAFKATWVGAENDFSNGTLFTLTFRIIGSGEARIGVQVAPDTAFDENTAPVAVYDCDTNAVLEHTHQYVWSDAEQAFLCVCGDSFAAPGDPDGDGLLTTADATLIMRYLNGWKTALDPAKADFSGDGKVSIYDAVLILRALAGQPV